MTAGSELIKTWTTVGEATLTPDEVEFILKADIRPNAAGWKMLDAFRSGHEAGRAEGYEAATYEASEYS